MRQRTILITPPKFVALTSSEALLQGISDRGKFLHFLILLNWRSHCIRERDVFLWLTDAFCYYNRWWVKIDGDSSAMFAFFLMFLIRR